MELHANLIDGEWVGGEAAPNVNPANTAEVVGYYVRGTAEDAKRAIAAAKAAFPAWSRSGPLQRHEVLKKAAAEILARKDELGTLLSREEGKTLAEGVGETVRAAQIFEFFAGEALRLTGELLPSVRPGVGVDAERDDPQPESPGDGEADVVGPRRAGSVPPGREARSRPAQGMPGPAPVRPVLPPGT